MYWLVEEWNADFEKWSNLQIFFTTDGNHDDPEVVVAARSRAQNYYDHRAKTCRKVRMTELRIINQQMQSV